MTEQLVIQADKHQYPVVIGDNLLRETGEWLQRLGVKPTEQVFLITDETVARFGYAQEVLKSVGGSGYQIEQATVKPGDASKSLSIAEKLYNALLDAGVRRNGVILALGGGVIGDLAGFVAATYQRGIRFLQLPTTLLAHDSSIGGKVGINLPRGKNLVGAFYPPIAVLYDSRVLRSLPVDQWQSGMAEVIKHGIIGDEQLFTLLERHPLAACPVDESLDDLLRRAIQVKKSVIEADEQEKNLRMVLNVGHTVGHAIEQYSHYQLSHGQAVALGIVVEGKIAVQRRLLTASDWGRMVSVLANHGLPTTPPDYPFSELAAMMDVDKKNGWSIAWTCALPTAIGQVAIYHDISREETEAAYTATIKETSP